MGKNKHAKNLDEASSSDLVQEPEGWKEPEMTKDDNPHGLLAESSFSTLFPKYREKYLQEVWPLVDRDLHKYNLKGELDLVEGSMTVKTTRKTWDPYAILNARDMITLLARFVPYEQATKIFENDVACDIIKISNLVPKKDRFIKRRQRLIGPNGTTLKAIEMLTNCYVLIQGKTVAVMGSHKGLSQVRKIVMDCMKNIHPIYDIKSLMIQQELAKDPALQNESWDRFLPKYKPKHESKRRKPMKIRQKGEYTPFPPAPPESKIDRELASGEYFLKDSEKEAKKRAEKWEKERASSSGTSKRKAEKAQEYIAPEEQPSVPKKLKTEESSEVDIGSLKTKIKKAMKHKKKKHKKHHDMEQPV